MNRIVAFCSTIGELILKDVIVNHVKETNIDEYDKLIHNTGIVKVGPMNVRRLSLVLVPPSCPRHHTHWMVEIKGYNFSCEEPHLLVVIEIFASGTVATYRQCSLQKIEITEANKRKCYFHCLSCKDCETGNIHVQMNYVQWMQHDEEEWMLSRIMAL